MKKNYALAVLLATSAWLVSCKDTKEEAQQPFDPSHPIEITSFYPENAGIATPMIMNGKNFGADTTGLRVYFQDSLGVKHRAGLVSSSGTNLYLFVPKGLTYKHKMDLIVERELKDGKVVSATAERPFYYKTQTAVTTVVGQASPDVQTSTKVGDLATATLSNPMYICLDDDDNIFITERGSLPYDRGGDAKATNDKGQGVDGNIVMASLKGNSVIVLKYGSAIVNAPAYSDEENKECVFIPNDSGLKYTQLLANANYIPRMKSVIKSEETKDLDNGNWKHCFVVNKNDHQIYTVMWKGQLVKINPTTRTATILLNKVGKGDTDSYVTFSPIKGEENLLYVCQTDKNVIYRVDVGNLEDKDKNEYHGEPYAGKAIEEGEQAGRGWEDGLLKNAKFDHPRQICFTKDGKLYIADAVNSCIRMIDTTVPKEKATVITAIGLPGNNGYKDGGPEIAKFHHPCGVAVNADGSIVYVADSKNKVIRKLSIE